MKAATIFAAFAGSVGEASNRTALVTPRTALTFRELQDNALVLGESLLRNGESGAVALLCDTPETLLAAFFACAAVGRPALVLDPARPQPESRELAARYGASFVAADHSCRSWSCAELLPEVGGEAEFYWGLTSGTTGEPKLFARSHRSWLESFSSVEEVFPFPPAAKILIPGSLSHSLFLYGAVHALCRGHTVIAPGAFRPDRAARAAREADCAYVVPAMLAEMLDCGLRDTGLRLIFCGGAKLLPEWRQRCEAALPHADLIEFYGASETSFVTYASTSAPSPSGSVGRPFPGVSIEIRDADGRGLPPGAEGAVHVASPMLFSRYVGEATAGPSFTAGDIGFVDPDGCLHLTGRTNRIINSRALKIRPEPIEAALLALPGVLRAAVIDLPDAKRGAVAVAAVEFAPGERLSRQILSEHCRTHLGVRFSPQRYYQADTLPLTRSGKVAFAGLREALMAGDKTFRELR